MGIIDITGELYNGMWGYEPPFPQFHMRPLPSVDWVDSHVYCDIFDGLHSQSGTYLETPAHLLGSASYPLGAVALEKLIDIPVRLIRLSGFDIDGARRAITRDMLGDIPDCKNAALLISCDFGKYWRHKRFLDASPYFTNEAMNAITAARPFLLGTDFARWENLEEPQGFFPSFYAADILMLAPCVNLEKISDSALLSVLPLKIKNTCCAPCRAFVRVG